LHWRYVGGQINKPQLQLSIIIRSGWTLLIWLRFLSSTFVILFSIGYRLTFFKFRHIANAERWLQVSIYA
jgi:hypothetical protein